MAPLGILAVIGTLHRDSTSSIVIGHVADRLKKAGCVADVLDFTKEPLGLFDPDRAYELPGYALLQNRVNKADVIILSHARPPWQREWNDKKLSLPFLAGMAGKLFVTIVASPEKGLTVMTNSARSRGNVMPGHCLMDSPSVTKQISHMAGM